VTALADTGDGWQALCTDRDRVAAVVDLRRPGTLSEHAFGYGPRRAGEAGPGQRRPRRHLRHGGAA
jgi:hypothetical protein